MRVSVRAALVALAAVVPFVAPLRAQEPTVVILVRHAEKAAQPAADPPLTPEGEARSRALVAALADTRLDGVVSTQFYRTRATALPVAEAQHLPPMVIVRAGGSTANHVQAVADSVLAHFRGRTVLVVGHSNTIPGIIGALGGPRMADFCDNQHDGLYTLVIRANGSTSLVRGHYGAPDGPAPAGCPAMTPAR